MIDFGESYKAQDGAPRARSLSEIIDALETTLSEFTFQVKRLTEFVTPRTQSEAEYHAELTEGYRHAAFMTRTLLNYQKGRLDRERNRVGQADGFDHEDAIDPLGRATPYADDKEAPV